jgi:phosphoribosyl-AMP cyclohydrolase / phosphoribosyl-ATP pyrophosphohydrolase
MSVGPDDLAAALHWLKRDAVGLVTVVVQDRQTGMVRMVAHADAEAVAATLRTGLGHFFSRSRQRLWKKGEESGHFLHVSEVWADCDADCLLYLVDPDGPSCHTGRESCFFARVQADGSLVQEACEHGAPTFVRLWSELEARREQSGQTSYTRSLLDKGALKIGEKLREEADELARAIDAESDERVVSESADLTYHLLVGLLCRALTLRQLQEKLASRFGISGITEKAGRKP